MLNEDDKKYLKGNIEKKIDDLDKKMSKKSSSANTSNPNSEISKKLQELYRKDEEKEDTKKYLEELKKKNDKGEATLAQKIEMMSLNLKSLVPEDFKEAVKDSNKILKTVGKDVSSGASRSLQGIDSLISRLMYTNPLTGMLWSMGKGITRDVWNIGAGALQAGWGVTKGIGQGALAVGKGAAGLLNASINMFKKKPKPVETEDTPDNVDTPRPLIDSDDDTEIVDDKDKSTAKKISELHDLFFKGRFFQKQEKEEKERQNILSKGLSGLAKGMQTVNKVAEEILNKKKMILTGLMLGAVAILGLAAWFKNGEFRKVIINGVKAVVPVIVDGVSKAVKAIWNGLQDVTNDVVSDSFDNRANSQSTAFNMDGYDFALSSMTGDYQQALFKKNPNVLSGISNTSINTVDALNKDGQAVKLTTADFSTGKLTPVLAPYDGKVFSVERTGSSEKRRYKMIIEPMEPKLPSLDLENLTNPQRLKDELFKKGDILAYATDKFTIKNHYDWDYNNMDFLKDYQSMVNKAKDDNYSQAYASLAKSKTRDVTDKLKEIEYHRDRNEYDKQHGLVDSFHKGEGWAYLGEKTHDLWHNKNEDIQYNRAMGVYTGKSNDFASMIRQDSAKFDEASAPINNINIGNNTDNKVTEQKQTLAEQDKQEKQTNQVVSGGNAITAKPQGNNISLTPREETKHTPGDYVPVNMMSVVKDSDLSSW